MKKFVYLILIIFLITLSGCGSNRSHKLTITNQSPLDFKSIAVETKETNDIVENLLSKDITSGESAVFEILEEYGKSLNVNLVANDGISYSQNIKVTYNEKETNEFKIIMQNDKIVITNQE